jgi:phage terminase large subunit
VKFTKIKPNDLDEFSSATARSAYREPSQPEPATESSSPSATKYPGDLRDNDPALRGDWQKLPFSDASLLANYYDPFLNGGVVTQHPWQIDIAEEMAAAKPTAAKPYKLCLCAANGSGKDKYVIAPFVIWFALTKIQSRCIITSASGNQLSSQTEAYIRDLAELVNKHHGEQIFRIRQRYIKCNLSGSEIRLFATDEAGKAEGYHPITPVSEMALIMNEAKSILELIFTAIKRCTGFNYWIEVSTPGEPSGHFHRSFTNPKLGFRTRRVTSYDCPHISEEERQSDIIELGEHSFAYRSKHLALFTSLGGQIIITPELLEKNALSPCSWRFKLWQKRVGIDIAAGGDETVCYITHGNKVIAKFTCREADTVLQAQMIAEFLTGQGIPKDHPFIFADDGHVGHSVIDMLDTLHGFKTINRIHNQSRALNHNLFGNRGAENWYRVRRLFEENLLVPPDDELTIKQLTTRYFKQQNGAKPVLESKKDAKAHGRPSPDRADAYILCFSDLSIEEFMDGKLEENKPKPKVYTADELDDLVTYSEYGVKPKTRAKKAHLFQLESKL